MPSDERESHGSPPTRHNPMGSARAIVKPGTSGRPEAPVKPDAGTQRDTGTKPRPARPHFWHRFTGIVARRFDAISLSTKLVACTLVLLMVGVLGISWAIRTLVGNYLRNKTDTQLINQADLIYNNIDLLRSKDNSLGSVGPTDYFLQVRDTEYHILATPLVPVLKSGIVSAPVLPADGSMDDVQLGDAFTTPAKVTQGQQGGGAPDPATLEAAKAPWRVLALRWGDDTDKVRGILYIGLSLSDQIDTINTLTRYCILVGIAIVLLGGAIATLLVQGTLTPLKRIEKTAAKIAAGDLSQRIPSAPENTEVGSLSMSLNSMLARIERSFREQEATTEKMKRFVSDASHELRTPLAAIHGYAELYTMQRDLPGSLERADSSIEHIESSSSRMTLLVEDLLSLARLDEGRGIDMSQQVRLTSLLTDASDDLHALDPQRSVAHGTLTLVPSHQTTGRPALHFTETVMPQVSLTADGSRLRQVVTNIIGNIHRYTPADSPVEIALTVFKASIRPQSLLHMPPTSQSLDQFLEAVEVGQSMQSGMDYAVMQFIDHGPGVPDAYQAQIFERFYTADPSRARQKGGTGLGMAIAQSVVRAHHGIIWATSTQGGGLTLTVSLPLPAVPAQTPTPAAGPLPSTRRGRIR